MQVYPINFIGLLRRTVANSFLFTVKMETTFNKLLFCSTRQKPNHQLVSVKQCIKITFLSVFYRIRERKSIFQIAKFVTQSYLSNAPLFIVKSTHKNDKTSIKRQYRKPGKYDELNQI